LPPLYNAITSGNALIQHEKNRKKSVFFSFFEIGIAFLRGMSQIVDYNRKTMHRMILPYGQRSMEKTKDQQPSGEEKGHYQRARREWDAARLPRLPCF
jgi:hypothetical protein